MDSIRLVKYIAATVSNKDFHGDVYCLGTTGQLTVYSGYWL